MTIREKPVWPDEDPPGTPPRADQRWAKPPLPKDVQGYLVEVFADDKEIIELFSDYLMDERPFSELRPTLLRRALMDYRGVEAQQMTSMLFDLKEKVLLQAAREPTAYRGADLKSKFSEIIRRLIP